MTVVPASALALSDGGEFSTLDLAERLDVDRLTVWRWARDLGHGPGSGRGSLILLTRTEAMVCRAWQLINANHAAGGGHTGVAAAHLRNMRLHAAAALQRSPARWLVATDHDAFTHVSAEEAAWTARAYGWPSWWLIDCRIPT